MKKIKYRLLKQRNNNYYKIQIKKWFWWVDFLPQEYVGWHNIDSRYYTSKKLCQETMVKIFGKHIEFVSPEWEIV